MTTESPNPTADPITELKVWQLLEELIVQQRAKVLKIGRSINPRLTADDIMNPFDWPEVAQHPQFSFEDGLLAGLISAQAAVTARFKQRAATHEPGTVRDHGYLPEDTSKDAPDGEFWH